MKAKIRAKLSERTEKAVMARIEEALSREEVLGMLDAVDDPRCRALLGLMMNPMTPQKASAKLFTLASQCGISATEFISMYRRSKIDEGMIRMSRKLPQIMEDIASDALNSSEQCWQCAGSGTVLTGKGKTSKESPCGVCKGTGQIVVKGDIDNRRIVLESSGVIRKGALFNQNISLGGSNIESFESLVGRTQDYIDAPAETVPALASGGEDETASD